VGVKVVQVGIIGIWSLIFFKCIFLVFYFPFIGKYNLSKGKDRILNSLPNLNLSTLI
jgi:hypothetical protein